MAWGLSFISEEDFRAHVRATIMKYGEKLESYDIMSESEEKTNLFVFDERRNAIMTQS